MAMNDHVEREIKQFQTVERDFFIESYKRSGRYRQEMVKALKEAGIPEEISWLPLIESGFKSRALSRSRALGLWQFIPSTGYKFGLKRNSWIDERLDSAKATAAAIAYLKELHRIFGDWATVLAAYNCGPERVDRWIRRYPIENRMLFLDMLPIRETREYVASIARNYYWYLRLYQKGDMTERLTGSGPPTDPGTPEKPKPTHSFHVFGSKS